MLDVGVFKPASFLETSDKDLQDSWNAMCLGAFNATQLILPKMLEAGKGTVIYTGATGSLKGSAGFVNLAIPKFGLRALAQCVAREFGPKNIHVVHTIIDGIIQSEKTEAYFKKGEAPVMLNPLEIANEYYRLHQQDKSVWTHELEFRPFAERW